MSRWIADDARPQVQTLVLALAVSLLLSFIPFANILTYPFRIFVTFIHEGGHALTALLTGGAVLNLRVAPDGSGAVLAAAGNPLAQIALNSAGYLGAMLFGALLLFLLRRRVAVRPLLYAIGGYILALTIFFGLSNPFTVLAGLSIGAALIAVGRFARPWLSNFLVAFLAVQCVTGALFDLRNLITISNPFGGGGHTDAANMAALTGIPALVWALLWTGIAIVILIGALSAYASGHTARATPVLPRQYTRRI